MTLKQRITDDIKAALLGGDRFVGETLKNLKAAILNEEVAQNKREEGLEDSVVEQIIAREIKKRNESIKLYAQGDRQDLIDVEQREINILTPYLPTQLSESEVQAIVDAAVVQLGATGMSDMGKVIGVVKSKVGNAAEGSLIAKLVKQALS